MRDSLFPTTFSFVFESDLTMVVLAGLEPSCPKAHRTPPVSSFQMLGLKGCTTQPSHDNVPIWFTQFYHFCINLSSLCFFNLLLNSTRLAWAFLTQLYLVIVTYDITSHWKIEVAQILALVLVKNWWWEPWNTCYSIMTKHSIMWVYGGPSYSNHHRVQWRWHSPRWSVLCSLPISGLGTHSDFEILSYITRKNGSHM